MYCATIRKNEYGELGYRIVNHLCDLGNYVSSELVANLANLVCTNPRWRLPSGIWIPNGRVATRDWWVSTKKTRADSQFDAGFRERDAAN